MPSLAGGDHEDFFMKFPDQNNPHNYICVPGTAGIRRQELSEWNVQKSLATDTNQ